MQAVEDLEALAQQAQAIEDYMAAGGDEGVEERPMAAPVDPYADIDPELLGADAFGVDEEDSYADRYGTQFAERILELGRVTKVVKGGKLMGFRCVAVVGDGKGRVGVGCQAGREVSTAVKRALVDAKKNIVEVPLVGAGTIPHRSESWFKAAGVVLQPAADGTGVIAGGAVRAVLELAGVQNVLGKRLGSRSTLNNARVTLKALGQLRTLGDYAEARGVPLDYMLS
jgi:small subunit ribosomal protein S5